MATVSKTITENSGSAKATWVVSITGTNYTASGSTISIALPTATAKFTYSGKNTMHAKLANGALVAGSTQLAKNIKFSRDGSATSGTSYSLTRNSGTVVSVKTDSLFTSSNSTTRSVNVNYTMSGTDSSEGTAALVLSSYKSDLTLVGSYDSSSTQTWSNVATITLNAPPTGTYSVTSAAPYYVDLSSYSVSASATAQYGGKITQIQLTVGSQTVTRTYDNATVSDDFTIDITDSGAITPTLIITDSRNQTTTKTLPSISVAGYMAETSIQSTSRVAATGDDPYVDPGVVYDQGTNAEVTAKFTYVPSENNYLKKPTVTISNIEYILTEDTTVDANTTYYEASTSPISDDISSIDISAVGSEASYSLQYAPSSTITIYYTIVVMGQIPITATASLSVATDSHAVLAEDSGVGVYADYYRNTNSIVFSRTGSYQPYLTLSSVRYPASGTYYVEVEPNGTENPSEEGWYTKIPCTWYESWGAYSGFSDPVDWDSYEPSSAIYNSVTEIVLYGNIEYTLDTDQTYTIGIGCNVTKGDGAIETATLPQAFYLLSAAAGGHGIGIGMKVPQSADGKGLHVDMDTYFYKRFMIQTMAGIIELFAGSTAPDGWLMCDGSAVSRTTYAVLYEALGGINSPYGQGDGSTTFNLPNFSGRMPVGANQTYSVGSKGGSANAIIPYHRHSVPAVTSDTHRHPVGYMSGQRGSGSTSTRVGPYGESAEDGNVTTHAVSVNVPAHNTNYTGKNSDGTTPSADNTAGANMPPYLGVNFIICTGQLPDES